MKKVVLVRLETSPEDIEGMDVAQGILTVRGGMTSHAAVVARGMGTCCVSGCGDIVVDYDKKCFTLGRQDLQRGRLDLHRRLHRQHLRRGHPHRGSLHLRRFRPLHGLGRHGAQAEGLHQRRHPPRRQAGREFGAEGIGLCRTEHMFFEADRIKAMREMIVADDAEDRKKALAKILPYQQGDFEAMYEAMGERPMTIRFLDPPLHEFLPTKEEDIEEIAEELGITVEQLHKVIDSLHEFNPMMGHRGCRLAVSYPEIAEMQTTAVINAAINVSKKGGYNIVPAHHDPAGRRSERAEVREGRGCCNRRQAHR